MMSGVKLDNILSAQLPQEVLDVSDRIGLKQNVPNSTANLFLKNRLPVKVLDNDLKYQPNYFYHDSKKRREKTHASGKRNFTLNAKERKKLFKLSKCSDLKYESFKAISEVWHDYIHALISEMHSDTDQLDLIRADYHGAQFVIEASRNPSLVGIKGIVVQETKNTFKLIAETNRIITVPKEGTLFTFLCNGKLYKICGNYMALSPQQRSRTKIKVRKAKDEV